METIPLHKNMAKKGWLIEKLNPRPYRAVKGGGNTKEGTLIDRTKHHLLQLNPSLCSKAINACFFQYVCCNFSPFSVTSASCVKYSISITLQYINRVLLRDYVKVQLVLFSWWCLIQFTTPTQC